MSDQTSPLQEIQNGSAQYNEYQNQPINIHSVSTRPYETLENNSNSAPFSNPPAQLEQFQLSSPSYPAEAIINQINTGSQGDAQNQRDDSKVRDAAAALLSL